VQSVIAAMVAIDPAGATRVSDDIQALWDQFGLFPSPNR
jgi:hypothetical protein